MRWFSITAILSLLASPAFAEESTLAHGKRLVETNCAKCHALTEAGDSPFGPAPPFREVAKNYTSEELVDGFMEGLAVSHRAMPDWNMTEDQAEAIAIYIMSLKRSDAGDGGNETEALGHDILLTFCSRCHAIEADGDSPLAKAPPFRDAVKRYEASSLEEALAEGIVTGHSEMPEFEFTPGEIAAIVAYLETLK